MFPHSLLAEHHYSLGGQVQHWPEYTVKMQWVDLIQLFRDLLTGQNKEFTRNASKERNEGQLNGSIM
jgi:hypothetical protein